MWLFGIPRNYMDMIEKISKCVFTTSLFLLFIFSNIDQGFGEFLTKISFGAKTDVFGIELSMALFYLPLATSLLEHIFQIHDRLSDLLIIRKSYDRNVIAHDILRRLDMGDRINHLSDNGTKAVLNKAFYKYASSTNSKIDPHIIYLTLNKWCWFWIILDLTVLILAVGVAFVCVKWSIVNLMILEIVVVGMIIIMCTLLNQIISFTKQEIDEIFSDIERKSNIKDDLVNALLS